MTIDRDPTPVGYIYVDSAFKEYQHYAGTGDLDGDLGTYLTAFIDGSLSAKVAFPQREGWFDVPKEQWQNTFFAERIFLDAVATQTWEQYAGRTFMVESAKNKAWIAEMTRQYHRKKQVNQSAPAITDYDPKAEPWWTLMMALAWIDTRSMVSVTWQQDDWREANGYPPARYADSVVSEYDPSDTHPAIINASEAFQKFRRLCGSSQLEAYAELDGATIPIPPVEWAYGSLELGRSHQEFWRSGRNLYSRIMVRSELLMSATYSSTPVAVPLPPHSGHVGPDDSQQGKPLKMGGKHTAADKETIEHCSVWIAQEYMFPSPDTATIGKKDLFREAQAQPEWGAGMRSMGMLKRAWEKAIAMGEGHYDNWTRGGSRGENARNRES